MHLKTSLQPKLYFSLLRQNQQIEVVTDQILQSYGHEVEITLNVLTI